MVERYEVWQKRAPSVKVTGDHDGLVCRIETDDGLRDQYGGIRIPIMDFDALRLELSFHDPTNILGVTVEARDAGDERVVRRYWDVQSTNQPSVKPKTFVLVPELDCAWVRHARYSSEPVSVLYIYVRV